MNHFRYKRKFGFGVVMQSQIFRLRFSHALMLLACMAGVLAMLFSPVHARSVLDLDPGKQPVLLADWGDYWIDTSAQLSASQVDTSADARWLPTPLRNVYPLKQGQALWIRFTIPPAPDAERWLLEIPYPALDRASLYTKDSLGQFAEQVTGDLTPVNSWILPHRYPLLVVRFNAEQPTAYLLRIENVQGFSAPLRFINAPFLLRESQKTSLLLGVYFGIAALGFALGLTCFIWLRDRAYLYYAVACAFVGLTLAAITGVAALHLWPNSPQWADRSLTVLASLALVSFLLVNAKVVSLAQRSKRLHALVWGIAVTGIGLSALLGLTDSAWRIRLVVPYIALIVVVVLGTNLWAWRRGDRFGGWLLLASTPFALAGAVSIARYLQWIPLSFATEQSGLASMVFELLALLAVLVLRSQEQRENARRISGMDRTDPATGLINEQVFAVRLSRMSNRSERLKHQAIVALIELTNMEQIQRDFGRKTADELPLRLASRLLSTIREIDTAAGLAGKRYGLLVEGPVSPAQGAKLAQRIIARCLMPYRGLHVECVAQVRVAYMMVPYQQGDANSLIARLNKRLNVAASKDDKRTIFSLTPS